MQRKAHADIQISVRIKELGGKRGEVQRVEEEGFRKLQLILGKVFYFAKRRRPFPNFEFFDRALKG